MEITCIKCNHTSQLTISFEVEFFCCPKCKTQHIKNKARNEFAYKGTFSESNYLNALNVGQTAFLNNQHYTITSVVIKRYNTVSRWAEYVLQNQKGEFLYLSEADGNFILLEQIEFEKKVGSHPLKIDYNDLTFDRYDYTYPKLSYALGYFDFNILEKTELIEFIHPPYVLSFERTDDVQTAYYGKHISRWKIKRAFNGVEIPYKSEMGMVQPYYFDTRNLALIFCSALIMMLLSHGYLTSDQTEKDVLDTNLTFDQYSGKDFVSPSFELKGSAAPLQISTSSNVDNSWANIQIELVNENTGEETYASKDIEYYHGYTDGENWTEGSNSENFNICGVAAGKYHLKITPQKAPEDTANNSISVTAVWNQPSLRNFFMTFLFMAIFVVAVFYGERYFEDKRWGRED